MPETIRTLRKELEQLRKNSALPYWRFTFAEFLLERAEESIAVGRSPEAQGLCERVRSWIAQSSSTETPEKSKKLARENEQWNLPWVVDGAARLRTELDRKKRLVPLPEREGFLRGLDTVERLVSEQQTVAARAELRAVRSGLIRRLQRSYRAWAALPLVRHSDGSIRPSARTMRAPSLYPIGPYNNQYALEEVLDLVGERDPIWVEDFIALYSDLQGSADRLGVSSEKAVRKAGS
jgi:hypothetical protein